MGKIFYHTIFSYQMLPTTKMLIKAEQKIEKAISNIFHRIISCRRLNSVQQKCHILHVKLIYTPHTQTLQGIYSSAPIILKGHVVYLGMDINNTKWNCVGTRWVWLLFEVWLLTGEMWYACTYIHTHHTN